ncbi:MAG: hypothetical protein NT069_32160 [Planctomycetota bacterium]|nr:hypothetical protein [Planctomycetota bacterium]
MPVLEWFLNTIGYNDREVLTHLDEVTLAFQRPGLFWLGMTLLMPIAVFVYRRQHRNLFPAPKPLLIALTVARTLIFGLLAATLAGPYLKLDHRVEKRPLVAVVIDHSDSMQLPAGPFEIEADALRLAAAAGFAVKDNTLDVESKTKFAGLSRAELAHSVLQSAGELFPKLAETYEVRFYEAKRQLSPLTVDPADVTLPSMEDVVGPATHLGDAVEQVLEDAAGRPVAGLVLLSDGQNTGGRSPADAAHSAAVASTPVFAVPVGTTVRLRDVAVVDMFTSGQVSVGDKAQVSVTIESTGFDGRSVDVQLFDGTTLLATRKLVLNGAEQQQIELSFEAKEAGNRSLTVSIPIQPEEPAALQPNNTDIALLRVSAEKVKILFIDGGPRWDFRFLKNAMRRDHGLAGRAKADPDIILDTEVARKASVPGATSPYPATLDDLAEYHTVILGDIAPNRLPEGFLGLLRQAVEERGLGLIVAAGPRATPHGYDSDFQDLLPVRLKTGVTGSSAPVYNPYHIDVTPEGDLHELLRLNEDGGRNREAWAKMPPYYWCAAVDRASSAASVLAVNPNVENGFGKMPLIAWQFFGAGRVLFLGTDSTWLWRQNSGDRYYYTFWGQAVRFVARRDESESKKNHLELQPVRVQPGEATRAELLAYDAKGEPRTERTVSVQVQTPDNKPAQIELTADSRQPGRYTGRYLPPLAGDYIVTYEPGDGSDRVDARMKVMASTAELRHPNVNRATLEGLATASGGQVLELSSLATLPEKLKGEPSISHLYREKTMWDNWLMLVLLVVLYSVDVGLRRLVGLT